MLRFFTGIFLLTSFACLATGQNSADEFTIQRILERYTETYGGLRDANRLASIMIEGVQVRPEDTYSFRLRKKRPALMHYELEKGATTLTTVFDGRRGWLKTRRGSDISIEELSGDSLELLRREARFESPLYRHLEKTENKVTLKGRRRVGSLEALVLRVEEPQAPASLYYLHPDEPLVLRIERLDEAGEIALQTLYRDYRKVDGYPFAHEIENRIGGETVSVTRVRSVQVNPGLLSFYFEKPEER